MSDFKAFTAKTVDDAIEEACRFFTTDRDKLEVEIISGGSTGIFGLVGKKKAEIRVRRRQDPALAMRQESQPAVREDSSVALREEHQPAVRDGNQVALREDGTPAVREDATVALRDVVKPTEAEAEAKPRRDGNRQERSREPKAPRPPRDPRPPREPKAPKEAKPENSRPERPKREPAPERPRREPRMDAADDGHDDDLPMGEDQSPASQELMDMTAAIMQRLLTPILEQDPRMEIEGTASRLNVLILDEEHSGLLIGREGQTLAALQYLANRIIARQWQSPVRVQINTGEYREKQDDNLRKMAFYLADKAKSLGRPQSTKPLSSYHRRVIHMALQTDETIQTRSKGDGPMKRVIIVPKRPKGESAVQNGQ